MKLYPWVESMFIFMVNITFAALLVLGAGAFLTLSALGIHHILTKKKEHEDY